MGDDRHILRGPKLDIHLTETNLGEFIFKRLKKQPMDKLFQVLLDTGEKFTFKELLQFSAQICQGLIKEGLKQGEVVSLIGCNSNQLHSSFVGVLWAGGIPHTIDQELKLAELQTIFQQIQPKWVLCERGFENIVSQCLKMLENNAKILLLNSPSNFQQSYARLEDILVETDLSKFTPRSTGNPDDLGLIICSSGTTGVPKGVGLSHQSVMRNILYWQEISHIDIKKPHLVTSLFSWITGVYFFIFSCIYGSFRVVTTSSDPRIILKTLEDYKLHGAIIPPHAIKHIIEYPGVKSYDLTNWKELYTGGTILGSYAAKKFEMEFPGIKIFQLYGATEAGGIITMPTDGQDICSVGRLIFNSEIKIVDISSRKILGANETGEICFRSDCIFKKYVGNGEAIKNIMSDDGWMCTGDIGYYSNKKELYITGRIKETLKYHNKAISPAELENYISALPGVIDVGIAGIAVEEDSYHLMAIIEKSPECKITADEIVKNVKENFSDAKHLKAGVHFVDRLPRSSSGKLKRKELAAMAESLYKEQKQTCSQN